MSVGSVVQLDRMVGELGRRLRQRIASWRRGEVVVHRRALRRSHHPPPPSRRRGTGVTGSGALGFAAAILVTLGCSSSCSTCSSALQWLGRRRPGVPLRILKRVSFGPAQGVALSPGRRPRARGGDRRHEHEPARRARRAVARAGARDPRRRRRRRAHWARPTLPLVAARQADGGAAARGPAVDGARAGHAAACGRMIVDAGDDRHDRQAPARGAVNAPVTVTRRRGRRRSSPAGCSSTGRCRPRSRSVSARAGTRSSSRARSGSWC